tara:strand:+ start:844 stop:1083 length:240 start_codon:yes stop_codon:yes gene_type:complete
MVTISRHLGILLNIKYRLARRNAPRIERHQKIIAGSEFVLMRTLMIKQLTEKQKILYLDFFSRKLPKEIPIRAKKAVVA